VPVARSTTLPLQPLSFAPVNINELVLGQFNSNEPSAAAHLLHLLAVELALPREPSGRVKTSTSRHESSEREREREREREEGREGEAAAS
jgi:hypothetical protein